jgi:alpha-beta hydrolase superfamily lysophospholipase
VKLVEEQWTGTGGPALHACRWEPDGAARGAVALVHGLGEHTGRYGGLAARLTDAGYAVCAFDLRGHGRSGGPRGHTVVDEALDDIDRLLAGVEQTFPGVPRFLYGHSLGGLLVLVHTLRRRPPVAGVVTSGVALHSALRGQKAKVLLTRVLGAVASRLSVPTGIDAEAVSRDPDVVAAYRADPLMHDRASLGFGRSALNAIDWTLAHAAEFPVPLLMVHGGADRIGYPSGTREFAARVPGDCTVHVYDGLYHEVHQEPEAPRVLGDVVAWLDAPRPA